MANFAMTKFVQMNDNGPFEDLGITDDDFVMLDSLKDQQITIVAYKNYTKDESDGVFIAFEYKGKMGYTATHAVGIVKTFQNPDVMTALDSGDTITATIIQKKSKKTGRLYYCFADE